MLPDELWKPSSFPVENIKRGNQGITIILLFNSKYKRRWINKIFLQDKHNINVVYSLQNWGKAL
jgi:hypothetical protein